MFKNSKDRCHHHHNYHKRKKQSPIVAGCILIIISVSFFIAAYSERDSEMAVGFIIGGVIFAIVSIGCCIVGVNSKENQHENNDSRQYDNQFYNNSPHIVYVETQPQHTTLHQPFLGNNNQDRGRQNQPYFGGNSAYQNQHMKEPAPSTVPKQNFGAPKQNYPNPDHQQQEKKKEFGILDFIAPSHRSHSPAPRNKPKNFTQQRSQSSKPKDLVSMFKKKGPQPKPTPRKK